MKKASTRAEEAFRAWYYEHSKVLIRREHGLTANSIGSIYQRASGLRHDNGARHASREYATPNTWRTDGI